MATAAEAHVGELRPANVFVIPTIGCVLATYAARVIAGAMGDLRWAYLYRERTHEGVALAQVWFRLVGGGVVALVAVTCFGLVARRTTGWPKRCCGVAAAAVGLGLMGSAAAALWVSGQSGCIGTCG